MTAYRDQTLTCRDCGTSFVFTVGEQEFYASRGFTNAPSRCPDCRALARREGGRGSPRTRYGGADSGARQMYPAVCAECGRETEVPFEPRQDRPVYCPDCFRARRPARY